jgi:hypothetical protein
MNLWYLVLLIAVAVLAGAAGALLMRDATARHTLTQALLTARGAVAAYLTAHPPDEAAFRDLINQAYAALPLTIRDSVSRDQFDQAVAPLLYQVEEAWLRPPPGGVA